VRHAPRRKRHEYEQHAEPGVAHNPGSSRGRHAAVSRGR
jgi:hypothetical protein